MSLPKELCRERQPKPGPVKIALQGGGALWSKKLMPRRHFPAKHRADQRAGRLLGSPQSLGPIYKLFPGDPPPESFFLAHKFSGGFVEDSV